MTLPGFGEIAERLRRSTVSVRDRGRREAGSGVIWNTEGVIVTNAHVARAMTNPTVELWDRRAYQAKVTSVDGRSDLAALTIDGKGLPVTEIANSDGLRVGELVIAVGQSYGFHRRADHRRGSRVGGLAGSGTPSMGPGQCASCARQFRRPAGGCAWTRRRHQYHDRQRPRACDSKQLGGGVLAAKIPRPDVRRYRTGVAAGHRKRTNAGIEGAGGGPRKRRGGRLSPSWGSIDRRQRPSISFAGRSQRRCGEGRARPSAFAVPQERRRGA